MVLKVYLYTQMRSRRGLHSRVRAAWIEERVWLRPSQTLRVVVVYGIRSRVYEGCQLDIMVSVARGRRLNCEQAHVHYEAADLGKWGKKHQAWVIQSRMRKPRYKWEGLEVECCQQKMEAVRK
jgi:hypothetical protein